MSASRAGLARRELLQGLLDAAGEALLALDEHGTIVEANEAAARLLGLRRAALPGKPLAALVSPDTRRRLRSAFSALAAGDRLEVELELLDGARALVRLGRFPAGAAAFASARLVPAGGPRPGEPEPPPRQPPVDLFELFTYFPYAVVALRRDLTVAFANREAKRLLGGVVVAPGLPFAAPWPDSPLQRVAERLVRVPAPFAPVKFEVPGGRTFRVGGAPARGHEPAVLLLEDVTDQYRQEQLNREFVRNAAHQLRTPLAAIASAVEVLQAGAKEVPEDRDRFLAHVERQTERLSRMAHALLVLARAQSREQEPRLDSVPLEPLFADLARDVEAPAAVSLRTSCPPGMAAFAERDLLAETLAILLDNAFEHTREGAVSLEARGAGNGDGPAQVAIEVSDTGPGILPEHREHVFQPFYRVGESGHGVGLGLAIAAQAVDAMGGTISVESEPGRGSRFTVVLPSGRTWT